MENYLAEQEMLMENDLAEQVFLNKKLSSRTRKV
jgi:hypothetical protein